MLLDTLKDRRIDPEGRSLPDSAEDSAKRIETGAPKSSEAVSNHEAISGNRSADNAEVALQPNTDSKDTQAAQSKSPTDKAKGIMLELGLINNIDDPVSKDLVESAMGKIMTGEIDPTRMSEVMDKQIALTTFLRSLEQK